MRFLMLLRKAALQLEADNSSKLITHLRDRYLLGSRPNKVRLIQDHHFVRSRHFIDDDDRRVKTCPWQDVQPPWIAGSFSAGLLELCGVDAQVVHAAHVKEHALADIYQPKEYLFANSAPGHQAGSLHIQMCFGKALDCAAVRTLSLCSRNVNRKYFAEFPSGCVAVEVVVFAWAHCRSP